MSGRAFRGWASQRVLPRGQGSSRKEKVASAGAREDGTGWGRAGSSPRGEGPAGGERAAEGREEGKRALPNQAGQLGGDRPADDCAGLAQATRPPGVCSADTLNRQHCVREAPGHVQPELAEKTVPPLGECPPPERSRPPGPHRRQPAPGPSPSPPRGRAPVAPGKLAPRAREGLGPTPGRATVPPGTWTLNAWFGAPGCVWGVNLFLFLFS